MIPVPEETYVVSLIIIIRILLSGIYCLLSSHLMCTSIHQEKYLKGLTRESKSFKKWFDGLKDKDYSKATLDQKAR